MKKVLFIGGPGNISGHTIKKLLNNGYDVTLFTHADSRDDVHVLERCHVIIGDRMDFESLKQAIIQIQPDAIVDVCAFHPAHLCPVLDTIDEVCNQYVFISTCDVYGYPLKALPQHEDDPWNAPNCSYAANKALCEQLITSRLKHCAYTIIRPAYSMGPHFMLTAVSRSGGFSLIPRLRRGLPIISPDDGNHLIHASNATDTGLMLAETVLSEKAFGTSYTLGAPQPITYDQYVETIARVLGMIPNFVHVSVDTIYQLAKGEIEKENLLNDLTRYDVHFSMDKFRADYPHFAWEHPIEEAIASFIATQDAMGRLNDPSSVVEEMVLAKL